MLNLFFIKFFVLLVTFPTNPSNLLLSGEHSFEFSFDFILRDSSDIQKTIFALVPRYTGLDLYKNETVVTITYEDKARYYRLPFSIPVDKHTVVWFPLFIKTDSIVFPFLVIKRNFWVFLDEELFVFKIFNGCIENVFNFS